LSKLQKLKIYETGIKGFSDRNLRLYRQFYIQYPIIWQLITAKFQDTENQMFGIWQSEIAKSQIKNQVSDDNRESIPIEILIDKLSSETGFNSQKCKNVLITTEGDYEKALEIIEKEKTKFKVGDLVVRVDGGNVSQDCKDFLSTYKWFKILDVNAKGNIDIGYRTPAGKKFMFSPKRFELKK